MKKTNAVVLLIVSIIIIIIGGGLYWGQKTGKIKLFAEFAGWPDVTTNDPAYTEIMGVGEKGWMLGYPDGNFQPDWDATRAQIVVGEVRARGDSLIDASQTCVANITSTWPFTDVPCDHWAVDFIATAKQAGIIDGYGDGSFKPDVPATRAELVVLIMKALGFQPTDTDTCNINDSSTWPFPDVPCDYWAYEYIVAAKDAGLVYGYASGNFEPDQNASRRDMAIVLYRAWVSPVSERTITGKVTDATSSSAIAGATVEVVDSGIQGSKLLAQADSTGVYSLKVATSNTQTAIQVRASATGYQNKTSSADVSAGSVTLNFALTRTTQTESTVTGTVRDSSSRKVIAGATVTVLGYENGSQLSDKTDVNGAYTLKIGATSGTFSVKVSATGYHSKTLSVSVAGGTRTLNFLLSKIETPGEQPTLSGGSGSVSAAQTGAVLPMTMVLIGTILALFSLIYLLRTGKSANKTT